MTGLKDIEREIRVLVVKYIYKIYSWRLEAKLVGEAGRGSTPIIQTSLKCSLNR
jgi:hypothetical protein